MYKKRPLMIRDLLLVYMVTRTRFELVNAAVKGRCVKPLHQRAITTYLLDRYIDNIIKSIVNSQAFSLNLCNKFMNKWDFYDSCFHFYKKACKT